MSSHSPCGWALTLTRPHVLQGGLYYRQSESLSQTLKTSLLAHFWNPWISKKPTQSYYRDKPHELGVYPSVPTPALMTWIIHDIWTSVRLWELHLAEPPSGPRVVRDHRVCLGFSHCALEWFVRTDHLTSSQQAFSYSWRNTLPPADPSESAPAAHRLFWCLHNFR